MSVCLPACLCERVLYFCCFLVVSMHSIHASGVEETKEYLQVILHGCKISV
jgi:hypothetical protein